MVLEVSAAQRHSFATNVVMQEGDGIGITSEGDGIG